MTKPPLFKCVHWEGHPWPWRVYSYFYHDPYDICDTEPSTPKCDAWCAQMWGDPGHVYLLMEGGWQFRHESDVHMFLIAWS